MSRCAQPFAIALLALLCVSADGANEPRITSVAVADSTVALSWDQPTNRFIIARAASMDEFLTASECVASSSGSLAHTVVLSAQTMPQAFYRLHVGLEVVEFPDACCFYHMLLAITNKHPPVNKIYDIDVREITDLDFSDSCIVDPTGLERLPQLISLNLDENSIADGASLAGLQRIETLVLRDNPLLSVGFVSALTSLKYLDISNTDIADIDALSTLTALTTLRMSRTAVDLTPLAALTNLTYLDIEFMDLPGWLGDLDPLKQMSQLRILQATRSNIAYLDPLAGLTNLTEVYLASNNVRDLEPLVRNARSGGLGTGDLLDITGNRLSRFAVTNQLPELESHGVTVIGP
jgi:Leucine-rich repeat (LRR) protein